MNNIHSGQAMIDSKNIQQLDLNLLKIFECMYQQKNMTQTAKTLHLSPSAISHAIKRLRQNLNDPLFVRQGQKMLPTAACQRIAPQLIDTLIRLRQILQQCGEFNPLTSEQTFKIAIHDTFEALFLPQFLSSMQSDMPQVSLISSRLDRDETSRQLASGEIDIAIDVALSKSDPIKHFKISSSPFCVLINRENPLINSLNKQSYIKAEHVAVSSRATGKVIEDIAFLQQGITRKIKIRCQTYQTAKLLLEESNMLLTLPNMMAEQLCDDKMVMLPMPISLPPIESHCYWHENTDKDDAMIWLREKIKTLL